MTDRSVIAARVLTVLAAAMLVGAVALLALAPPGMPLGNALLSLDPGAMRAAEGFFAGTLSPWIWQTLVLPLMVRPAWLLPADLGLVCAGLAVTFRLRHAAAKPRRWWS